MRIRHKRSGVIHAIDFMIHYTNIDPADGVLGENWTCASPMCRDGNLYNYDANIGWTSDCTYSPVTTGVVTCKQCLKIMEKTHE
jgi:hypothetical protein